MIKGILVDFDGTLVDTLPFLKSCYHNFLNGKGSEAEFEEFKTTPISDVVKILKERYGLEETYDDLLKCYYRHVEEGEMKLLPGVHEFFHVAKIHNIKIGIITSASKWWVEKGLKNSHLDYEFILSGHKTDPLLYQQAIRKLNLPATLLWMIDDSPVCLKVASKLGLKTFAPEWKPLTDLLWSEFYEAWIKGGSLEVLIEPAEIKNLPADIERIWEEELKRRPFLYNGNIVCYHSLKNNRLTGWVTDYKTYLASLRGSHVNFPPLAVCGVTIYNNQLLIGKRSKKVTLYPDCWELVPQGNLEGGASFLSQIARELEEEASIDVKNIISTEFQCLIFDKNNNLLEIVVKIKVDNPHFAPTDETSEFHWMEIDEALRFFKNHNNIVPLSYLLLKKAASNYEL